MSLDSCLSSRLWLCAMNFAVKDFVCTAAPPSFYLNWWKLVILICIPCVRAMFALAVTHAIPLPRSSLEPGTAPGVHNLVNVPWEPIVHMVSQALPPGVSPSKTVHIWVLEWCLILWSTFETVKLLVNKITRSGVKQLKLWSRSKSEYWCKCPCSQFVKSLVFLQTEVCW